MAGLSSSEVVLHSAQRINEGDSMALEALTAEEFVFTGVAGSLEAVRGDTDVRAFWDGYFTPQPHYEIHVQKVLTSGDGVAILGQTTGSHVPPEIEARETVLWVADVQGGKVATWSIYCSEGSERV